MSILSSHGWPHPVLTRIHDPGHRPSRERVLECATQCNANAASITTSTLGVAGFGLLGITVNAAEYLAATGQNWVLPVAPVAPAEGGTQFEIAERMRLHKSATDQFQLYQQVNTAIRNQLLAAADDVFWAALSQPLVGYGQRTAGDFITHMISRYARFDESVRDETEAQMAAPWTAGPFEVIVNQIDKGAATYAQASQPMSDQQKCDKLYSIAKKSGRLSEACKKWRFKAAPDKTWVNCTTHFIDEANDLANDETTSGAGYNQANLAQYAMEEATNALQDSTQRFANMANAKQTADVKMLKLEAELAATKAQLTVLQKLMDIAPTGNQRNNNRNRNNRQDWTKLKCYCWSCGYNEEHDSPNCPKQQSGHKSEATRTNPLNGKGHRGKPRN
jgi:hypothetical protein